MRNDVHHAALRAAAKVAFSVAFVTGCSSPATPGEPAVEGESDLTSGCHQEDATAPVTDASAADTSKSPLACQQVVDAAFPTEGDYPGEKQAVSAEVQTCCAELLDESRGVLASHRWDCCANLPPDAGQSIGIACTPWGPPVPPAMKRREVA